LLKFLAGVRVGFRALIILSCGPAMRNKEHFRLVEGLIQR
jgi:hypothetical protein